MAIPANAASQKAGDRPISFLLDNQSEPEPLAFVDLVIRPEELTWTESSRATVNQTLAGAWVDNFGPNIPSITISGHTGWRAMGPTDEDGLDRFQSLHDNVFTRWHEQRQRNIDDGLDPNLVRLIFSDALDDRSVVVMPQTFVLRRSRSRPLLVQFQISLVVLDEEIEGPTVVSEFGFDDGDNSDNEDAIQEAGLESLDVSMEMISSQIPSIGALVSPALAFPVAAFMEQSTQVFGAVGGLLAGGIGIGVGIGLPREVIGVAQGVAMAGMNVFRTLASVPGIPQFAQAGLMGIAGAFANVFCVLQNAFGGGLFFQDYSLLYGASNCSSTSGGRPISVFAGVNPFYDVVPMGGPLPIAISAAASVGLASMVSMDAVLSPMDTDVLGSTLRTVTAGISFPVPSLDALSGGVFG